VRVRIPPPAQVSLRRDARFPTLPVPMSARIQPQLVALSEDIAEARAELAMARDLLAERGAALEESRLRMLIAETPVADRDLHRAAAVHALARAEVDRLEGALAALREEQRRLVRGPA
jgi:hypothetical protein